jgi:uncharacterized membrane protein
MEKQSLTNLFVKALTQIVIVLLLINVMNLIFELTQLESFDNYSLTFMHGYFTLNGKQIGLNIFTTIIAVIVLAVDIMLYRVNKKK